MLSAMVSDQTIQIGMVFVFWAFIAWLISKNCE